MADGLVYRLSSVILSNLSNSAHMVYIGKHCGMPLFSRFGIILLFVPFLAFGSVRCTDNGNGTWTCFGDSGGSGGSTIVTNIVGVCTNCIQMTPAQCEQYKAYMYNAIDECLNYAILTTGDVEYAVGTLSSVVDEGDGFNSFNSGWTMNSLTNSYQYPYVWWRKSGTDTVKIMQLVSANNSIYNYYNDGVRPSVNDSLGVLSFAQSLLEVQIDILNSISNNVSMLNCNECTASFGGDTGGGGDGGGSSSSSCPCSSYLATLTDKLDEVRIKVNEIAGNVSSILKYVKSISSSVSYIATNNFSYANYFKDKDGTVYDLSSRLEYFRTEGVGSSYYTSLNWMNRIELLIASLVGASSNTVASGATSSSTQSMVDSVTSSLSSISGYANSLSSVYATNFDGIKSFFNACKQIFPYNQPDGSICLWSGSGWIGDTSLTVEISPTIMTGCRTCTSLVWCCLGLVFFFWICCYTIPLMVRFFTFIFNLFFRVLS